MDAHAHTFVNTSQWAGFNVATSAYVSINGLKKVSPPEQFRELARVQLGLRVRCLISRITRPPFPVLGVLFPH